VDKESCDFFVTAEIAPYLEQSFTSAGRTHVRIHRIPLQDVRIPEPEVKEIKDTLASLRLDSVIAAGFRIGRSLASTYISQGKAAIDGLPCEKPDKQVEEGAKISVRGLGKIKLAAIHGKTKKDRISVTIHRYV
jgi:RNA-binding protein YlmH